MRCGTCAKYAELPWTRSLVPSTKAYSFYISTFLYERACHKIVHKQSALFLSLLIAFIPLISDESIVRLTYHRTSLTYSRYHCDLPILATNQIYCYMSTSVAATVQSQLL